MTTIEGSSVLVTGANRGLGSHFVAQLLERGASRVYATARDPLKIDLNDPRVIPLQLDVTVAEQIRAAAAVAEGVDVVVNNAGIASWTSVLEPGAATLRREIETNLMGTLAVTRAFAESLKARQGAVVNIVSVSAWIGLARTYGVSKAALWSATDSLRLEFAPHGVQVLGVYSAQIDTDLTAGSDVPKSHPADVVRQVLDGLEAGDDEVLPDELTRAVRHTFPLSADERAAIFGSHAE
ncbi:SDR family oxidoreductase [Aeromicrobium ginsengisoli]|uniref:SDR family oxidoreductase n=1 Tax=Aeromicrobium ginsengisoli TaxID=363867 RepID=A0A5M4FET8_9ACTN|nr:SDR family oxidoreductase [Aeromicrobium ginsengisoli]KAA1397792.1 SDR family oxidoreductase [Aeromicrobium ginsengisoli]